MGGVCPGFHGLMWSFPDRSLRIAWVSPSAPSEGDGAKAETEVWGRT